MIPWHFPPFVILKSFLNRLQRLAFGTFDNGCDCRIFALSPRCAGDAKGGREAAACEMGVTAEGSELPHLPQHCNNNNNNTVNNYRCCKSVTAAAAQLATTAVQLATTAVAAAQSATAASAATSRHYCCNNCSSTTWCGAGMAWPTPTLPLQPTLGGNPLLAHCPIFPVSMLSL